MSTSFPSAFFTPAELAAEVGIALRREDETLYWSNPTLRALAEPWGGVERWWRLLRSAFPLPAATQCPVCGLAQHVGGIIEAVILLPMAKNNLPEEERVFDLVFAGHAHGLTDQDGVDMVVVHDVTSRRLFTKNLLTSIRQYETVCESIQDVFYRVDMEGVLIFISPSSYKLLAYTPDELINTSLTELCIDPEYWNELLAILENSNTVQDFDLVLVCKKGNQVPVSLNARLVFDEYGNRVAIEGIIRDITEREHLDSQLAERTRKLQETMAELEHQKFALDQHAIVTVSDSEGKIVYANRRMAETSQYSLSELKGASHRILNSNFHPNSFFEEMWRAISSGRVWHGEIRNRKKDGSFYWVDCTVVPFMTPSGKPYQYVNISTDITERINAEARMERSRSFLLSISDAMGEGVYVLDLQGRLTFLNREAERLLGWRESELLGKNLHDAIHFRKPNGTLVPAEDCPVHRSLLGRSFRMEEDHFIRKDGTMIPVSYVTAPLVENGEITGSVAVFQDIAQRIENETELKRARDMALEGSRLKSEFLANMSHEIRTPMNAIIGMNDLLMDTPLNNEQREFAEVVRDSADSLLSLINDILDFSKIEAGKLDLETMDFTLMTVVEGSAELLHSMAHEKGISLMTFISPRIPRVLRGDPGRLRQMLLNLIGNAVKFTEEGDVVVRAVVESQTPTSVTIYFSVTDSGIGLSLRAHERLFKPFTQADGNTTRKYGGTGLGLAICKRLVDAMGGQIGVQSKEGEGSTFWFRITFLRAEHGALPELEDLNLAPLKGVRVLAVMESPSDREILEGYLNAWGMDCQGVVGGLNGLQAIEQAIKKQISPYKENVTPYQVIIVSAALSDMDALAFAEELEKRDIHNGLRLIAMDDTDDRDWKELAREAGYHEVIAKPLRQSELVECLNEALAPGTVFNRQESVQAASGQGLQPHTGPDTYDALESGKLILLVEDNPVNQKLALIQLKKLGYAVHAVSNGQEAVDAVSHLPYALILMDCQMPVMDGFEATHAIRKIENSTDRHIPIIAMTANAMKGDRERCIKSGMDDYLSKPVSPEDFKKKLEYWMPKSAGDLPPIEINQLRQLFGHDDDVIRELLQHFLPSARDLMDRMKESNATEDSSLSSELANELKGACSNIGALGMAQLARRMERSMAASDWQEAEVVLDALERSLTRVENFVRRF